MANVIKTEDEIISDLTKYIASGKKNRPSVLSPLKKIERTQKVCDFVFANFNTFKVNTEIKFVPKECLTEEMLIKLVLVDPRNIELLDEELITTSVMTAFEFSKRRGEHLSAMIWHEYGLKFDYPKKIFAVRDSISALCDELNLKFNDEELLSDKVLYVNKVSECIIEYFRKKDDIDLKTVDKVKCKYKYVDINRDKKVLVLISGLPDSGKTTFGKMLHHRINGSIFLDSDVLAECGRELDSLQSLNKGNAQVVIFTDPNADYYFSEEAMKDYDVVNIVVVPKSIELMYRHSKHNQKFVFEVYVEGEARNPFYEGHYRDITVTNPYDERLWNCVDSALEDMAILLDFDLPSLEEVEEIRKLEKSI